MTKHDFKVGDRVSYQPASHLSTVSRRGALGTVCAITWGVQVQWDGDRGMFYKSTEEPTHLALANPAKVSYVDDLGGPFNGAYRTTEIKKTWIIAVLDNKGKPRPATVPQVYVSATQAEKVAKEMAEKHPGETFMVLQGTAVAATPAVKSVELVRL